MNLLESVERWTDLHWTPDYSVGIPLIDEQHQELFLRINAVGKAAMGQRKKEEVGWLLNNLGSYVITHFDTEEGYMIRHTYPEQAAHMAEHTRIIAELTKFRRDFDIAGPRLSIISGKQAQIGSWLENHICSFDRPLADFLQALPGPKLTTSV